MESIPNAYTIGTGWSLLEMCDHAMASKEGVRKDRGEHSPTKKESGILGHFTLSNKEEITIGFGPEVTKISSTALSSCRTKCNGNDLANQDGVGQ